MSLLELVVASALFLGSSAASLQVWSRASLLIAEDQTRLEQLDALDGELAAMEARLRELASAVVAPRPSCPEQLQRLSSAVQGQAPAERIQREVVMASGDGPLVLRLKSGALERTRIYSPQAFGGCGDGAL